MNNNGTQTKFKIDIKTYSTDQKFFTPKNIEMVKEFLEKHQDMFDRPFQHIK